MNIILSPQIAMPVFNPVVFITNSTNSQESGFEYLCDIYTGASTTNRIARLKVAPDPVTGYGVFQDCGDILKQIFSYDVGNNITGTTLASNSFKQYRLYGGEQYQYYFEFDDNFFPSAYPATPMSAYSSYIGFSSVTNVHYFSGGDRVLIAQQANATNTQYNGVHTILFVPDNHSFIIDVLAGSATSAETGTTIYSDLRKTVFSGLTSTTASVVYNGAIPDQSFPNYTAATYDTNYSAATFLTNIPRPYTVRADNYGWINIFSQTPGVSFKTLKIDVKDTGGTTTSYTITNTVGTANSVIKLGLLPWNLNRSGFGTIITSAGTSSYSAYTLSSTAVRTSEVLVFNIDDSCESIYGNTELIFQDRLGSFIPFNFKLAKKETQIVQKQEYTKYKGQYSSSRWYWNSFDRGQTTLYPTEQLNFSVTSDWMPESYASYLKELISSPVQYEKNVSGETAALYPIIVTDTNYEPKKRVYAKLINATVNYKYAFQNQIQSY